MAVSFVVPVFRKAPYLASTVASLRSQVGEPATVTVRLVEVPEAEEPERLGMARAELEAVTVKRAAKGRGIGGDWNDALACADADVAVLAHSDDEYLPGYAAAVRAALDAFPRAVLAFTDNAYTDRSPRRSALRLIKRALNPAGFRRAPTLLEPTAALRGLRFGNFIPCPAVAFHRPRLAALLDGRPLFDETLRNSLDWKAWVDLAQMGAAFVYVPEPLMRIRVHPEATTQATIQSGARGSEETELLTRLWGPRLGRVVAAAMRASHTLQGGAGK